jgi:hypothetical protein
MTTTTQSRKKLALLIGNDNYEDGEKLHCCINDALAIGNKLDKMGFDITIGVDLTYKQMILKILQFEREIKKDDLVVIDNQCLSEDPQMYRYRAIGAQIVLESIVKRQPYAIIFLLDCCWNYLVENNSTNTNLIPMKCVTDSMIVFTCDSNEITRKNSKNGRNSLFTYYLLKHLIELNLTVEDIMCRISNEMFKDTYVLLPSPHRNQKLDEKI